MGLNIDLVKMLGLPEDINCTHCDAIVPTGFNDFDIEAGSPSPSPGVLELEVYCDHCNQEFALTFNVTVTRRVNIPERREFKDPLKPE